MLKQLNLITTIIMLFIILFCYGVICKKRKQSNSLENDVLEKSEIIVKYPMYTIRMPPRITTRSRTNTALVDPEPVSCKSKNITNALSDLRKKIKCIPRDTVVEIVAPDGAEVVPNTVVVKRCGGMCSGSKKCVSAETKSVNFYVRSVDINQVYCSSITVSEDTKCKCGCLIRKRSNCLSTQKYDKNLCKCYCVNKDEYQKCIKKDANFKWNHSNCSCECKHKKVCTTGTVWVSNQCRCVKLSD